MILLYMRLRLMSDRKFFGKLLDFFLKFLIGYRSFDLYPIKSFFGGYGAKPRIQTIKP